MKLSLALLVMTLVAAQAEDFKLADGREIKGATVSRKEADGLVLLTDAGITKVKASDLSPSDQKRLGLEPVKVAAPPEPAVVEAPKPKTLHGHFYVRQVLKTGVLVTGECEVPSGVVYLIKTPAFLSGAKSKVEGDNFDAEVTIGEPYSFTDTDGAERKVRGYQLVREVP